VGSTDSIKLEELSWARIALPLSSWIQSGSGWASGTCGGGDGRFILPEDSLFLCFLSPLEKPALTNPRKCLRRDSVLQVSSQECPADLSSSLIFTPLNSLSQSGNQYSVVHLSSPLRIKRTHSARKAVVDLRVPHSVVCCVGEFIIIIIIQTMYHPKIVPLCSVAP